MDLIIRKRRNNNRQTIWIQNRKVMCHNLLSFYSRVIYIIQEKDGWADCIYLDLKKAFDKVPLKRLLWKLEHIAGLKRMLMNWIEDNMKGREKRAVVKDEKFEWKEVKSGIPQGSVLAPIMFSVGKCK